MDRGLDAKGTRLHGAILCLKSHTSHIGPSFAGMRGLKPHAQCCGPPHWAIVSPHGARHTGPTFVDDTENTGVEHRFEVHPESIAITDSGHFGCPWLPVQPQSRSATTGVAIAERVLPVKLGRGGALRFPSAHTIPGADPRFWLADEFILGCSRFYFTSGGRSLGVAPKISRLKAIP